MNDCTGQQLAHVKARLPVVRAIVDTHLGIVTIGNGLPKAQQIAPLRLIGPHHIGAIGASRMRIALQTQVFHMVARRAQTPFLHLGQTHIDLIDFHSPLVGVKAVFRREFRQGRIGRTFDGGGLQCRALRRKKQRRRARYLATGRLNYANNNASTLFS